MLAGAWRCAARFLVLALILPLALSTALPGFARAVAGPAAHFCRCEIRGGHSTCACPICNPDRADLRLSEESIRGKCGDDDLVFGGALAVALAPGAGFVVLRPAVDRAPPPFSHAVRLDVHLTPPTPPPRTARV